LSMSIQVRLKEQCDQNNATLSNLATPKAGAKHELLCNKLASEAGLLNKR